MSTHSCWSSHPGYWHLSVGGHSQMATTADICAHVLQVLMADAAERMDAALAQFKVNLGHGAATLTQ